MENTLTREQMLAQKYPKSQKTKHLILIMLYRFLAMGIANGGFSLLLTTIVGDLGFDAVQRAAIVSMNSTGQLVAVFVIGFLIDRMGTKKMMGIFVMLIGSFAFLMRGFAVDYNVWLVIMFIWGFAYTTCVIGTLKVCGIWFTKKELQDTNGMFTLSGPLGQLVSMQIALAVCEALGGWRNYFLGIAICMFIVFALFMILCKNRTNEDSEIPPSYEKKDTGIVKDIIGMAKVKRLWFLFIADAAQGAMISLNTTYGLIALQNDPLWGLETAVARRGTQMIMIGCVIGYFVIPKLVRAFAAKMEDKSRAIGIFSIACGFIVCACYSIGFLSHNYAALLVLLLIGGICQGGYISGPKSILVMQPEVAGGRAGTATTMCNIFGRIGLVVVSAAIGALAITLNDSANMMLLLYGVLVIGPIAMIGYMISAKRAAKKASVA